MKSSSYFPVWALLFLSVLAVFVRSLNFSHVFQDGHVYFYDGDPYLHARNILLHIKYFPHFITFDYYGGYPVGTPALWPPVLDYLLSLGSLLIGLGEPTVGHVETFAALVPPLIGGTTVVAAYFLAKEIFPWQAALLSALLLALMPPHVESTVLGRPDNEMMEPLMTALLFLGYLQLEKKAPAERPPYLEIFLLSAAAFVSLLFWRGATLWIGLVGAAVFLDITLDFLENTPSSKRHVHGAMAFLLLASYMSLLCVFNVWGNQNTFSFTVLSWFHASVFGALSASIFLYGYLGTLWIKKGFGFRMYLLMVSLTLASFMVISLSVFPSFRGNMAAGLDILGFGRHDPWLQSIIQYRPFIDPGNFSVYAPVAKFGWVFWLVPLILGYMGFEAFRKGREREKLFFLFTTTIIIALAIARTRFIHILALNMALTGGWLLYGAYRLAGEKTNMHRRMVLPCTVLLGAAVFYPLAANTYSLHSRPLGFSIKGHIEDAMLWLRLNTPAPKDPYAPLVKPPYSVMAQWDFGGWLEYVAERPVVATLFGWETYGLKESAGFYLAKNEAEANALMDRTRARYVVVRNIISDLDNYARIAGKPVETYSELAYSQDLKKMIHTPRKRYFTLFSSGLLYADGLDMRVGSIQFPEARHYRLVYESAEELPMVGFPNEVKKLKIFEYLPGARVRIFAVPGQEVSVSSTAVTNQGRRFEFIRKGKAGTDGTLEFVLPYAERTASDRTGLVMPYTIRSGKSTISLTLSESDVLEGKHFQIRAP